MIFIPPLRTRRMTLRMRELTIGDSIAIASMPGDMEEAACSEFLRKTIESVTGLDDPAKWTVQERQMAVCHYLAATLPDGPDFSIGQGRYSDYLRGETDGCAAMEMTPVGTHDGDEWNVRQMTGAMAESIERTMGEVNGMTGRLHWLMGGMAMQLVRTGEELQDGSEGEGVLDEFLRNRMQVFAAFPESDFGILMQKYLEGRDRLSHLFVLEFSADGLVALAKGGEDSGLPPARFPVNTCVSRMARELGRRNDATRVDAGAVR